MPPAVRLMLIAGWLLLLAFGLRAATGAGGPRIHAVFTEWLYPCLYLLAAVVCLVRARRIAAQRAPWILLGVGIALWGAGFVYYDVFLADDAALRHPNLSDVLWLAIYPLGFAALVALLRACSNGAHRTVWLDAATGALALSALAWSINDPIASVAGASAATIATNIAFPLGDLLLLGPIVAVFAATDRRLAPAVLLTAAAFSICVAADFVYFHKSSTGTYSRGGLLDVSWPAASLLIAEAAWRWRRAGAPSAASRGVAMVLPALFSLLAVAVLAYTSVRLDVITAIFAAGALVAAVIRMVTSVADARRLQSEAASAAALVAAQNDVLELVASGAPLADVLELLVRTLEREADGARASIWLLDRATGRLVHGAAPSLDRAYTVAISTTEPGGDARSCVTAPLRGQDVVSTDVERDPRWAANRELARQQGIRACWSSPILSSDREVLGTLALHYAEPRGPSERERSLVHSATHLAGIAIERQRADERLAYQALHDPLTDLPNRVLFLDRLDRALAHLARRPATVAVLFLDVDDFKSVNDSFGHSEGDVLLRELAPRLQSALRASDTLARFGGDEFAVLCEGLQHRDDALEVAERLRDALRQPVTLGGREHYVSASVGIAVAQSPHARSEALLRDADAAMYVAKERSRGRHEVFDERLRGRTLERLRVDNALRGAVERGEMRLAYQPLVSLEDGRMCGVEALVRWTHPELGPVPPDRFITAAERNGLIVGIGTWVLEEACRQAVAWRRGHGDGTALEVSVNVSAHQLTEPHFAAVVEGALERAGASPHELALELTESALIRTAQLPLAALETLRSLGVRVALDDFGTGYSSLSYLERFPLDALKIDRGFVKALDERPATEAIFSAIVAMGDALGLDVVAEGIENADQLERVRAAGCRIAQGYHFAPPAGPEAIEELLRSGFGSPAPAGTRPNGHRPALERGRVPSKTR